MGVQSSNKVYLTRKHTQYRRMYSCDGLELLEIVCRQTGQRPKGLKQHESY